MTLAKEGFEVSVVCGYPKEYSDKQNVPLFEVIHDVNVFRVKYAQVCRRNFLGRIINYFSFTIAVLRFFYKFKKFDLIITYTNPPILPIVSVLSWVIFKVKFILISFDVYPEIALKTKSLKKYSPIAFFMKTINCFVFRFAKKVVTVSEDMQEFLRSSRIGKSKEQIVCIHNWFDGKDNYCTRNEILNPEFFTVSYFGNMGICQEFETLFKCIEMFQGDSTVRFQFAGHGCKFATLRERAVANNLKNVSFKGFLKGDEFIDELIKSDILFLSLEPGLVGLAYPSKIYSYYMAGKPILAVLEEKSFLAREIMENQGLGVISHGDAEGMKRIIENLKRDFCYKNLIGLRNRTLYENLYSKEIPLQKYVSLVRSII